MACISSPPTAQTLAADLLQDLHERARTAGPVFDDGGLTDLVAQDLRDRFQAAPAAQYPGHAARDGRGDLAYWQDHGRLTGELMVEIARRWRGHQPLYRRVGELHDVDYLAFPHDGPGKGAKHPVPLVRAMLDRDVHPAICCAVLEHAPYAGRGVSSSRLSAALSAAEDLATLAASKQRAALTPRLSATACDLLQTIDGCVPIKSLMPLRVEQSPEHCINAPLARVMAGKGFAYDV